MEKIVQLEQNLTNSNRRLQNFISETTNKMDRILTKIESLDDNSASSKNQLMNNSNEELEKEQSSLADENNQDTLNKKNENEFEELLTENGKRKIQQQWDDLSNDFNSEAVDYTWAPEVEQRFKKILDNELFSKTKILSSGCKTTFCMLKLEHDNTDVGMNFEDNFNTKLNWTGPSKGFTRFDENGKLITTLYLVKEGEKY